jgi:hypothetical protein
MKDLQEQYAGDLNNLHEKAQDGKDLESRLKQLGKGIGDVTVNIFLRELRTVWVKARPALSPEAKKGKLMRSNTTMVSLYCD